MNIDIPIIRIKNAYLLKDNASVYLHELWGNGEELADDEWLDARVLSYQDAWKPHEQKILAAMTEMLGLRFRQNIIDVYVAPWFNAFSDPLVIGIMSEPDVFVDLLTHELIHRLLTDNTAFEYDKELITIWEKLFGKEHTFGTLIHIPVHAVLQAIYLDTLEQPERLKRDKESSEEDEVEDYIKAWGYVSKTGYKEIIEKLRKSYGD